MPAAARCLLAIDTLAFRRFQRGHLRHGILFVGGDTRVPDQHCANVSPMISIKQHFFATRQGLQIVISAFRCKDVGLCKPQHGSRSSQSPAAMAEAQNGAQAERGRPHPWPIELSSCLGLSTVPLVDDAGTSVSYRNISGFAHRN